MKSSEATGCKRVCESGVSRDQGSLKVPFMCLQPQSVSKLSHLPVVVSPGVGGGDGGGRWASFNTHKTHKLFPSPFTPR